ncbi:conserved hypothetical protein [Enterobacterales bacterium 8AC]|nr:conserved hypothetical protein [Enterobacterales bacterium 8AC]
MSNHNNYSGYSSQSLDLTAENPTEQPLLQKGASKRTKSEKKGRSHKATPSRWSASMQRG